MFIPKGFTLIELIAVIAVLAAAGTLFTFFLKEREPEYRLYTETRALQSVLQKARELSLANQKSHGLVFDGATYELRDLETPAALQTSALHQTVSFSSLPAFADATVSFNYEGAPSAAGTIILENTTGNTKSVIINPSGYINVQE